MEELQAYHVMNAIVKNGNQLNIARTQGMGQSDQALLETLEKFGD